MERTRHEHHSPHAEVERIHRAFVEAPSRRVELFANNLMRPDGFVKTLILGELVSSAELASRLGREFPRTHRSYYHTTDPGFHRGGLNDYLSFSVGRAQSLYRFSNTLRAHKPFTTGGLGFSVRAKDLLQRPTAKVTFGLLNTWKALQAIQHTPLMEPEFLPLTTLSRTALNDQEITPPKSDFLTRVHLSRKADLLTGGDQAEANLFAEGTTLPRISLNDCLIFVPERSKEALKRLIRLKLQELTPWRQRLVDQYGIDLAAQTPDSILAARSTIYWYSQPNIESAIEHISTHFRQD